MRPRQRAFLSAYRQTCNVSRACQVAKVGRSSHYRWLEQDPQYREAVALAKREVADTLEGEAIRRAFEGVQVPVGWHKGQPGAYITQYSDRLLIFLLKGAFPEKYADRRERRGTLANIDVTKLPDEALARIADGEHPHSVLASLAHNGAARARLPRPSDSNGNESTVTDMWLD